MRTENRSLSTPYPKLDVVLVFDLGAKRLFHRVIISAQRYGARPLIRLCRDVALHGAPDAYCQGFVAKVNGCTDLVQVPASLGTLI